MLAAILSVGGDTEPVEPEDDRLRWVGGVGAFTDASVADGAGESSAATGCGC